MIPIITSNTECGTTALLVTAFKIIQEAAKIMRVSEKNGELKVFFADLAAYCAIFRYHVNRISSAGISLNDMLQDQMLSLLSSSVSSYSADLSSHGKLRHFNEAWGRLDKEDDLAKLNFIQQCLDFGSSLEARDEFTSALATWEENLRARYPEDYSQWTAEDFAPQKKISEPSYGVWNAAKSIFKALVACKDCSCSPVHDFGARLCLGTYRKPLTEKTFDEELDFDLFLSLNEDWHEARIHTWKETTVKWAIEGETQTAQSRRQPSSKTKSMKVKRLCEPIEKIKTMAAHRLEFKVMRGQLYKLQSERSLFSVDKTKASISLEQFLKGGPRSFTERTRRILAVLLSHAVLHLHDTPWLHSSWSSADVVFFRTTTSAIPLRPFIQTPLSSLIPEQSSVVEGRFMCDECQSEACDCEEIDPDDLIKHQCQSLVTLAVMLMEVYFVTPFDLLAQKYGIEMGYAPSKGARYLDAELVFRACRDEIPDNFQFHYAVEKCLDPTIWEDEDGQPLESQLLRTRIYEEVVRPLENELIQAYNSISIEDLDQFAQTLDFGSWDQTISGLDSSTRALSPSHDAQNRQSLSTDPTWPSYQVLSPNFHSQLQSHDSFASSQSQQSGFTSHPALGPKASTVTAFNYNESAFFDDDSISETHSMEACSKYATWKSKYQAVYEKFIPSSCSLPKIRPLKIAILDTGIDLTHPDVEARIENIAGKYNWLNENFRNRVHDRNGHGTFSAGLLLDYAPDAQLYVAKIAEDKPSNPAIIAKAITFAVETWQVDIVSMSFGFPTCDIDGYNELEDAIMNAYSKHVLLFAAASNNGGKLGRAYPAREQNVICIHSTDTNGNRSRFSPTAVPDDVNLATVGEAVESGWPVHLCDDTINPSCVKHKSGTSFATPIAAGIAAFLLHYARIHIPEKADMLKRQKRMKAVLRRISEKGSAQKLRDGYHFIDISLYSDGLFGKDKEFIDLTIRDLLRG